MNSFLRRLLPSLLLVAACSAPAGRAGSERWIPLFNGRDLQGWTPKIKGCDLGQDPLETFRVEGGVLKVRYDNYSQFGGRIGHLFFEHPFSSYLLRFEYRFTGEQVHGGPDSAWRNSGVMIHCQPPETMRRDQDLPVCLEVQLLGAAEGWVTSPRPTANLCTPGTRVVINGTMETQHCTDSSSPTFTGNQWVAVELAVLGGQRIQHLVSHHHVVLEYGQARLDPADPDASALIRDGTTTLNGGWIALQSESHPVEFRRVEILPLD